MRKDIRNAPPILVATSRNQTFMITFSVDQTSTVVLSSSPTMNGLRVASSPNIAVSTDTGKVVMKVRSQRISLTLPAHLKLEERRQSTSLAVTFPKSNVEISVTNERWTKTKRAMSQMMRTKSLCQLRRPVN